MVSFGAHTKIPEAVKLKGGLFVSSSVHLCSWVSLAIRISKYILGSISISELHQKSSSSILAIHERGSTLKRSRRVFRSNAENTKGDEAQNTNLQLGNISGIRGKSTVSEVRKTPPRGTIFMENTQASPNDQLPLSMLTNQSLRTTGSVFNVNTPSSAKIRPPLSNFTNHSLRYSGSVFNLNTQVSPNSQTPLSNLTNHILRSSGSVFNLNTQVSPNTQTPLSNLTNHILRSSGEGINSNAQTNTNNRPSLSQLTNNRSRSSGLKKTAQTTINKDTTPLSNMTNKRKRLNGEAKGTVNNKRQVQTAAMSAHRRVDLIDTPAEGMPITRLFPDDTEQTDEMVEEMEISPVDSDAEMEDDDIVYDGYLYGSDSDVDDVTCDDFSVGPFEGMLHNS
ncbi:hypothetical protein DCAR_0414650 [Daucus carota subsp. sativus]|uniref:Uncharacterized protein n=1 Tax=Daucus carota subsp. sativus TaxID=79200 RepID=A0A164ZXY1_DAUCS|nr:hypothetical protein DCAR_0414650 [Daucus carota subsp. sativus]